MLLRIFYFFPLPISSQEVRRRRWRHYIHIYPLIAPVWPNWTRGDVPHLLPDGKCVCVCSSKGCLLEYVVERQTVIFSIIITIIYTQADELWRSTVRDHGSGTYNSIVGSYICVRGRAYVWKYQIRSDSLVQSHQSRGCLTFVLVTR